MSGPNPSAFDPYTYKAPVSPEAEARGDGVPKATNVPTVYGGVNTTESMQAPLLPTDPIPEPEPTLELPPPAA
jgi:hypothetical protein